MDNSEATVVLCESGFFKMKIHLPSAEETTADGEKSKEGTPTAPVKPAKPTADEIRAAQAEMRKTLEAKKNASKMKTELLQKKQELLEKQIKEHKVNFGVGANA